MNRFIWLKHRSIKLVKTLFKRVIPTRLWVYLKKKAGGYLPSRKEYASLLMQDWITRRSQANSTSGEAGGVTLVGFLSAANGLGEAARSTLRALQAAGIPYSLVDLDIDVPERQRISHPDPGARTGFYYQTNLLHVNPSHLPYLWEQFGALALLGRRTIGIWYWELPAIPAEWMPAFQVLDEIWAPSRFVQDAIHACSPIPVHLVPPCIEVKYDEHLTRSDFGLPEECFLFLCAYDVLSVPARKNPQAAIEAFERAFHPGDRSIGLVIKINNAEENPDGVAQLEKQFHKFDNAFFIKQILSREHFNALIHQVDAYISLHRSEGFALVAAEAMYLGKPVIMTNWSGNTDFMTAENSCKVDYHLEPVGQGVEPYDPQQQWAEPDIAQASQWMLRLSSDRALVQKISENGRKTIIENYSTEILAKRLSQILDL